MIFMTKSLGNYHVPPNHDLKPFLVLIRIPSSWNRTSKYLRAPKEVFPNWKSVLNQSSFPCRKSSPRKNLRAKNRQNNNSPK